MKPTTLTLALAFAASILLPGCTAAPGQPQSAPPAQSSAPSAIPPPTGLPVSINAEMVSLVDHAAHALWDVEREGKKPKTNDDWEIVAEHATQLAAVGTLIRLPGTGVNDATLTQQPNWQTWSKAVSDAGLAALQASHAMNVEALIAANSQLVEACEGCHKEYKPSLPSEGIVHKHMHATE